MNAITALSTATALFIYLSLEHNKLVQKVNQLEAQIDILKKEISILKGEYNNGI